MAVADYTNGTDSDLDGWVDGELSAGTDPTSDDSDRDGVPDGWEVSYGLDPISGIDQHLIAWWPLDEDQGVVAADASANWLDGVITNATAYIDYEMGAIKTPGYKRIKEVSLHCFIQRVVQSLEIGGEFLPYPPFAGVFSPIYQELLAELLMKITKMLIVQQ